MSTFPDDPTLIARGKYSTLSGERRDHLRRVAKLSNTLQQNLLAALRGMEDRKDITTYLTIMRACLANLEQSWTRMQAIHSEQADLSLEAWGKELKAEEDETA
jgi:hypothetical protein